MNKIRHIAVVGGGIAGLYATWRLLQQNEKKPSFVVHLYESEGRLGDRIRSEEIPGIKTLFRAELGAMRFRPSHKLLNALLAKFEIPTRQFDLPPPAFYVRGRRFTAGEITSGRCAGCHAEGPFHLRENERGKSAEELIIYAIDRILNALNFPELPQGKARQVKRRIRQRFFDDKTWTQINQYGTYQGLPLYSIGLWNLLQHFLSNEAYVMVHDVLSLESILGNWNAAEAIPWFLSEFASDQFDMVPGGLSTVAERLASEINAQMKDDKKADSYQKGKEADTLIDIRRGHRVTDVNFNFKRGKWILSYTSYKLVEEKSDEATKIFRFVRGESGQPIVDREGEGDDEYDSVILALPKRALMRDSGLKVLKDGKPYEKTDGNGVVQRWPFKWINWVKGHPMFKLFLLYEEPWWMGDDIPGYDNGRVFTDLPLRQVYYFSPMWIHRHGAHKKDEIEDNEDKVDRGGRSVIMASYSDEHYVSFWDPMLNPEPESGLEVNAGPPYLRRSPEITDEVWQTIVKKPSDILAKRRMVDKVQLLLTEIHGREIPQPILGVVRDWDAGWHTWIVGSKPWDAVIRRERVQPVPSLYLCGEAYSTEHGWIEGALKSAEQVLKELGVSKPGWLTAVRAKDFDGYIGCSDWDAVKAAADKGSVANPSSPETQRIHEQAEGDRRLSAPKKKKVISKKSIV